MNNEFKLAFKCIIKSEAFIQKKTKKQNAFRGNLKKI